MAKLEIQLGADSSELLAGLNKSEQAIKQWVNQIRGLTNGVNFGGITQGLNGVSTELNQQRVATEQARTETERLRTELQALRLANAQNRQQTDAAAGSYREAQQRLTALGREIRNAAGGFTATTPAIQAQIAEYRRLNEQLTAFDREMGNHQRNVGNYGQVLSGLSPIFGRLDSALNAMGSSLQSLAAGDVSVRDLGASFRQLAAGALAFIATPIGATIAILGSAFALFQANKDTVIQFDSGLKNVAKTTGLAGAELQGLSKELINVSRNLEVVGTDKLLEYGTVAGQLGVKGSKNIQDFAKSLSQLEIASNLKGEEGATQVARFLTLVDGGVQNVGVFGDELVNLGNNFAATEREIIANAEAISQNVGLYKIGRQEVLAYATATKALGIEAELVGSTFNRTLGEFEKAIRTGKGVDNILKIVGGTSAQLSKRFKEDASGVFNDYIKGLNGIFKAGGSVNAALEATGVIAVRDQRVIATLASSGYETLARAMDEVKVASGALGNEFDTASTKLENGAKRVGIAWDNLVLTIENGDGVIAKNTNAFLGFVASRIDRLTDMVNGIEAITKRIQQGALNVALERYQKTGEAGSYFNVGVLKGELDKRENVVLAAEAKRKANAIAAGKSELELRKQINEEQNKLANQQRSVDRTSFGGGTKFAGYGGDGSKQINDLKAQKALVQELKKAYDELFKDQNGSGGEATVFSSGGLTEAQKRAKAIADVYKNLKSELASSPFGLNRDIINVAKDDVKAYEKALDNLIKLGIKPTSDAIKELQGNINDLGKVLNAGKLADRIGFKPITTNIKLDRDNRDPFAGRQMQEPDAFLQRAIRSSLTGFINDSISALTSIGQKNYDIEQKYSDLRRDATQEQIALYTQMERLEKSVSTSLLATITTVFGSLTKSINDVFIKGFSDKISKVVNGDDFQIGGLSNKVSQALVAGAALAGGLISGISSPTSTIGQGIGGALSGAATGAALGSAIPGIGTLAGAIGGGILGALGGIFGASKAKKQEELQRKQLELQKKQLEEQKRANALAYSSSIIGQMTNNGIITGVDRDAYGNIVGKIEGKDLVLIIDRTRNSR